MSDVTRILSQISDGDPSADEQLLPLVDEELRKLATAKMAQETTRQRLEYRSFNRNPRAPIGKTMWIHQESRHRSVRRDVRCGGDARNITGAMVGPRIPPPHPVAESRELQVDFPDAALG